MRRARGARPRISGAHLAVLAMLSLAGSAAPAHAQRIADAEKKKGALTRALEARAESRASARAPEEYDDAFRKYTKRFFGVGYDWRLFKAQGMAESDLTPGATSRVGARGIMQLMPATYKQIRSVRREFGAIDDPEWNIAAGIMHDRYLWTLYPDSMPVEQRRRFMFAAYNAGEGTIRRARGVALSERLDVRSWESIESVAPRVQRWRYRETLGYVRKIEKNHGALVSPEATASRGRAPAKSPPPR